MNDRYHYDRNGNYKGRSSSDSPGLGTFGSLVLLLVLLPVLPEILGFAILLGPLLLIGCLVFWWLSD